MHADLEAIVVGFEAALAGRSAEDCQRHPGDDPRRWDAQQIVAHLVLTYQSTEELLQKRLDSGHAAGGLKTVTQRILQWLVIGRGILPKGARAPDHSLPERLGWSPKSGAELVAGLRAELEKMDGLLGEGETKFGKSPVGTHFIFGPLTARQWRRFHRVHGLHHLKQVASISGCWKAV